MKNIQFLSNRSMRFPIILAILLSIPFVNQAQSRRVSKKVVVVETQKPVVVAPRRGAIVRVVPTSAVRITYKKVAYRFHNGVFYKPVRGQFVEVTPPKGIRISTLPRGYKVVTIGRRTYFRYQGVYYVRSGRGYKVVPAP